MRKFLVLAILIPSFVLAQGIGLSFGPGPGLTVISNNCFPVVIATNTGTDNATSTTAGTVQLPAGITAGDLLILYAAFGISTVTNFAATGWTVFYGSNERAQALYRIADGSEGSSLSTSWTSATSARFTVHRINNWFGSGAPEVSLTSGGTGTTVAATGLTPSWGNTNTLWAVQGAWGNANLTGQAANLPNNQYSQNGTASLAGIAVATANATTGSFTPASPTFSFSASVGNRARTIGVKPAC